MPSATAEQRNERRLALAKLLRETAIERQSELVELLRTAGYPATQSSDDTLEHGGKVIIPVPAVGRAQEIMLIIDGYMKRGLIKEAPVFIEGMISEATAIHTAYPEYFNREMQKLILHTLLQASITCDSESILFGVMSSLEP